MQTNFPPSNPPQFPELDQLFQDIQSQWELEIQSLSQVSALPTSPIAPVPPLTAASSPRRRSRRKPLIAASRPVRRSRRLPKPKPGLRLPGTQWLARSAAAVLILTGALAFLQAWRPAGQADSTQKIRRVMSQNTLSKVAAFRKEVAEGNHYMPDSDKPLQYVVQEGDTVTKLARKFHVNPNTIIKNNDRKKLKADRMVPGTRLTILPVDGIAHPVEKGETIAELAKRYKKPMDEIIEVNDLDNPHMIVEKQRLIIPNASELRLRPQESLPTAAHTQAGKLRSAARKHGYTRTGNRLSWPSAGIVTSNFGWRWFRMHQGIDVAAPIGTPIRAVKEGRVVASGWMGGYGYAVDVDHGNGLVTRYAHCSELHVRVGQLVSRGQVLAAMGSTGHSTGPHLHFEVHLNGEPVNPRNYF